MKKLLLLLLLSLGFIGSANANSIEGAFGYKLGQVVEDAIESDNRYLSNKTFSPKKPLPGDFRYFLYTTRKDKKVSSIRAFFSSDSYSQYYCSDNEGIFFKIMKIANGQGGGVKAAVKSSRHLTVLAIDFLLQ